MKDRFVATDAKAGDFVMEVHDPTGIVDDVRPHADRLATLNGKTLCELSNGVWEDARTFPLIRSLLKEKFPDLNIVPFTEFPVGTAPIDDEATIDMLVQRGCDALMTGNAA